MKRTSAAALLLCSAALLPRAVRAQSVVDVEDRPRISLGPLGLTPTLTLRSFGVDNNVFNEPVDPKQDVTGTLGPTLTTSVRAGRVGARVNSSLDLVYFKQYTNQRAVNTAHDLVAALRFHRLTPFVTGQYSNVRERPSLEIDTRARHRLYSAGAGIQAVLGSRLTARVEGRYQTTRFDEDAEFEGARLAEQLNETAVAATASVQYAVTPLTRTVLVVQRQQDRFEFSRFRDATSVRITPGLEFAPTALISGRALVGVRVFDAADPHVPDFTGVVASLDLAYTYHGQTQFGVRTDRDVSYSFNPGAPYYLQTSFSGTITHRFTRAWDVTGSAGRQHLSYRALESIPLAPSEGDANAAFNGTGWSYVYGGAVGWHVNDRSRVGFNLEYSARPAGISGNFENFRYFTTVSYAF